MTNLTDYSSPRSFCSKMRAKRIGPLMEMIEATHKFRGAVRILDMGGTRNYWHILPAAYLLQHNVTITVVNLEQCNDVDDETFTFARGDCCALAYRRNAFDIVHSNSVIEHVGSWADKMSFAHECHRLAPIHYVQTPNFWFPVEPHAMCPFIHWLPMQMKAALLQLMPLSRWGKKRSYHEAYLYLEHTDMITRKAMAELFPNSQIVSERFFGLRKSITAISPR